MTTVLVDVRTPGAEGPAAAAGRMEWKPTKRRDAQGYVVLPAPFSVELTEGQTSIEVAPSGPNWAWKVTEYIDGGITRTVAVPEVMSINYVQLVTVDPLTLLPTAAPSPIWYAYTDGLALSAEQARAAADVAAAAAGTARDGAAGHETAAAGYATAAAGSAAAASADADAADLAADQTGADAAAAKQAAQAADGSAIAADGSATAAAGSAAAAAGSASDAEGFASGFRAGTATALLPTDAPTLTISGPPLDRVLDLGIPAGTQGNKGDKGDPGGIVYGTNVAKGTDFNTITADGVYRMEDAVGPNQPPAPLVYGTLVVHNVNLGTRIIQIFYPATSGTGGEFIMSRTLAGGIWYQWKTIPKHRVDNTAGRAVYMYDYTADRDLLVYGDTGQRRIEDKVLNGWSIGQAHLRREGHVVYLGLYTLDGTAATNAIFMNMPYGFRAAYAAQNFPVKQNASASGINWMTLGGVGDLTLQPGSVYFSGAIQTISWTTNDSWPSVLPGSGTVPPFN